MMRSSNPALSDKVFEIERSGSGADVMTLNGTVVKTGILLAIVIAGAAVAWNIMITHPALVMGCAIGGIFVGLVLAVIICFNQKSAPYLAPFYAFAEGVALGAISSVFEQYYPGIVPQAVGLTFGTLAGLLMAYLSGVIRATENFKLGVTAATGGIMLVYMVSFSLSFFGTSIPYLHETSVEGGGTNWIGIGFSLFVVVIAALNLVLDFDFIEKGVEVGAPKYMEWYGAFGLLVTLVWLYIEILHLLARLRGRR